MPLSIMFRFLPAAWHALTKWHLSLWGLFWRHFIRLSALWSDTSLLWWFIFMEGTGSMHSPRHARVPLLPALTTLEQLFDSSRTRWFIIFYIEWLRGAYRVVQLFVFGPLGSIKRYFCHLYEWRKLLASFLFRSNDGTVCCECSRNSAVDTNQPR